MLRLVKENGNFNLAGWSLGEGEFHIYPAAQPLKEKGNLNFSHPGQLVGRIGTVFQIWKVYDVGESTVPSPCYSRPKISRTQKLARCECKKN